MSVNKVMLLGNVGTDVQVHYFQNGGSVGRFSLATNESYKDKQSGEKITQTEWHKIVATGKVVEILEKYVKKGTQLFVEGKLKTRSWQTESGDTKYQTEIHLLNFTFAQSKNDSGKVETVEAQVVSDKPDDLPW